MSLFQQLQKATSEEDVKAAYIKALGLKNAARNLIDIQTKEVWFETKAGNKVSIYKMFTQLLHYINEALVHGDPLPPFLCVADAQKAAIMKTETAIPLLEQKIIRWGKSASDVKEDAVQIVSQYIGTHFVQFRIETHEKEFIETVKKAILTGEIIRTQITPNNIKQVFDKWVELIGSELKDVESKDYSTFFYADIMTDGRISTHKDYACKLTYTDDKPAFIWNSRVYELASFKGYECFWAIYSRPPKEEYRNYLLERRDALIPLDEKCFKGAFYTPLHIVGKAYDLLEQTLGSNWQREYVVWDMCCGVGNLEAKHSNLRNVFMSTLDEEDINIMQASRQCLGATIFQYDYLNDDVADNGEIDYSITNKVPQALQKIIKEGKKKILVLINPPYGEAGNSRGFDQKGGIAKTKWASVGMDGYGKSSNELFTQFVVRISKELPNAVLAMFSTLKYINAENFEDFRKKWKATYANGFVTHSKAFEGLSGNFPIGFLVWKTGKGEIDSIETEVLNKDGIPQGAKDFCNIPKEQFLNKWLVRPRANKQKVVPLSNAVKVSGIARPICSWKDGGIGYMYCDCNDVQNVTQCTALFSSAYGHGHGFYVTPENLEKAFVTFTARKIIIPTWLNDRDQFLQPNQELPEEFINDCLVWMLFHGSNLTASADNLEWNGKQWSIVNHFIPFTEQEVGCRGRFESDFMVRYMNGKEFSPEAIDVLNEGRKLWQAYFAERDNRTTRNALKLNRPDVGWYQVRNALKARETEDGFAPVSLEPFEIKHRLLTEKLRPLVYEYGFLK